ncbi:MAG: hypothetical protein P8R42_13200 [Candidatus Binatia bacterium]|nr:hypothetical protein [Candidatus Binatia bacterium]
MAGTASSAEEPPLFVEVIGKIDAPLAAVRKTLLDLDGFGAWFPSTDEWRVLARTQESATVHGRLGLPWPVDDRDYVARYSWADTEDRGFVLEAVAVVDAAPKPADGVVRVEEMHTTWNLEPLGTETAVRYVYAGSLGGRLPDWVARIGWEMQTGILMDALAEEVERRTALKKSEATTNRSPPRPPR